MPITPKAPLRMSVTEAPARSGLPRRPATGRARLEGFARDAAPVKRHRVRAVRAGNATSVKYAPKTTLWAAPGFG